MSGFSTRGGWTFAYLWLALKFVVDVGGMSRWGTTPSKWVLGLGVRSNRATATGGTLPFLDAVARWLILTAGTLLGTVAGLVVAVEPRNFSAAVVDSPVALSISMIGGVVGLSAAVSILVNSKGRGIADQLARSRVVRIR